MNRSKQEWLELRKSGISGTDASAIMGVNPYSTIVDIYYEKVGEEVNSRLLDIEDVDIETDEQAIHRSLAAIYGKALENTGAELFARRTGFALTDNGNEIIRHPTKPHLIGTPDRIIEGEKKGILEIKTAMGWAAKSWEKGIPPHYYAQLQHYLSLSDDFVEGWMIALLGVDVKGRKFEIFHVPKDEKYIEAMQVHEDNFWFGNVVPRISPQVNIKNDFTLDIDKEPSTIVSEIENNAYLELKDLKKKIKSLEEKEEFFTNYLKSALGQNKMLIFEGQPIAKLSEARRVSLNSDAIKKEMPDVYSKYSKETIYHTFKLV